MKRKLLATLFACSVFGIVPLSATAQVNVEVVRSAVNKGNALMHAHHFAEAIAAYEEALKADPGNLIARSNMAEAHNNWGIACFSQHKYKEAAAQWQKCLELAPGHANARRNMAVMMRSLSQQGISLVDPEPVVPPASEMNKPPPNKVTAVTKPSQGGPQAQTPKVAPTEDSASGAVLILTPGLRQPGAQTVAPTASVSNDPEGFSGGGTGSTGYGLSPATSSLSNGGATPMVTPAAAPLTPATYGANSGDTGFSANGITPNYAGAANNEPLLNKTDVSPLFPVTPRQFVEQAPAQPQVPLQNAAPAMTLSGGVNDNVIGPNTTGPGEAAASPFAASTTPGAKQNVDAVSAPTSSLEEQLAAVEVKVYGQKHPDLTVMQRIEKIERDSSGHVQSGTIIERIEALKQSFGIQ